MPKPARWLISSAAVPMMLFATSPLQAQFVFQPAVNYPAGLNAYPTSVAAGDYGDDGFTDVVVTGRNVLGVMLVMMGNIDGGYDPPELLEMGVQTDWVEAAHLDQDAHLDLAIAYRSGRGKIAVLKGHGDGTFGSLAEFPVGRRPSNLVAVNLDGDNDIDLAVTNSFSDSISILQNDGNAVFAATQTIHIGQLTRGTASSFYMTSADFDSDGDHDIAVAMGPGYIAVLKNDGAAFFSRPVLHRVGDDVGTPASVTAGDLDNDGDVDLVYAELTLSGNSGNLAVLNNLGDGQFEGVTKFPTGDWVWYAAVADLDGDGLPDALVTDALAGTLALFRNETATPGQLALSPPQIINVGGFPRSVRPFDVDGDCDLDLLVANIVSHSVNVLINDTPQVEPCEGRSVAARTLRPPEKMPESKRHRAIQQKLEDLDRDGKITVRDLSILLSTFGSDESSK